MLHAAYCFCVESPPIAPVPPSKQYSKSVAAGIFGRFRAGRFLCITSGCIVGFAANGPAFESYRTILTSFMRSVISEGVLYTIHFSFSLFGRVKLGRHG